MVSERPLVILALVVALGGPAPGQDTTVAATGDAATTDAPTPTARPPIELRPYKIRAVFAMDSMTRIDAKGRENLIADWKTLAGRMVGPAWNIEVAEPTAGLGAIPVDSLAVADMKPAAMGVDKVWLIRIGVGPVGFALAGRELDVSTGFLGSPHRRETRVVTDLPRQLFFLASELFTPTAEIGEAKGDVVPIAVQAAGLPRGAAGDLIAAPGMIFRPIRVFYRDDGSVIDVQKILFSYLKVTARDGPRTTTTLIRGVRDPLTKRIVRKNRLIALGIKPAAFPTRLRFVLLPDRSPGAGYTLTSRPATEGTAREIATTDREGRVSLPPGFASGLVILRLIAGKSEPMVELPIMPGESGDELTIPFDPRPQTIAMETQLDALRDSIIDLVAIRSRLERRMKAREAGDDWKGVEEALAEYRVLPPRDGFVKRLERIEEEAKRQETKSRSVVLTRTARAQLADTRSLIDRYLDDEVFRAYDDAASRARDRDAKAAQQKTAAKPAPTPPASGRVGLTPARPAEASEPSLTPRPATAPAPAPAPAAAVPF